VIAESHKLKDTLLLADQALRSKFGENGIFKKDQDGKIAKNKYGQSVFADEYAAALHTALNGMVEKQMRKSISTTADFWFTAWVNAGKPDLSALDPAELTTQNSKQLQKEMKLWKQGKLFGIESEKEF
jgi:hypothetical protein